MARRSFTGRELLLMLTGAMAAYPQDFGQDGAQSRAKFRSDVQWVNVAFSVRDRSGRLVENVTREEVEVYEDGVVQPVRFFGRTTDLPLTIGLIVDASGSQKSFVKDHHRDVDRFLKDVVGPKDRAFLLRVGNSLRLVADHTSSAKLVMEELDRFEHGERGFPTLGPREIRVAGTAFYDALYYASLEKMIGTEPGRRALVVFSDGEDNASAHHMIDAIEAAQSAGALVYAVRYTEPRKGILTARNKYGMSVMARIAGETGGAAFDARKEKMGRLFREIGAELRTLYEVAYSPLNASRDGTFRKVRVHLR